MFPAHPSGSRFSGLRARWYTHEMPHRCGGRDLGARPVGDVTRILADIERGDLHAAGQPLSLVYEELRKLAAARVVLEAPGQSLRATALVHEAYLRHVGSDPQEPFDGGGQKRLRIDLDALLVEPPDKVADSGASNAQREH